jgi:hypothetical protein
MLSLGLLVWCKPHKLAVCLSNVLVLSICFTGTYTTAVVGQQQSS